MQKQQIYINLEFALVVFYKIIRKIVKYYTNSIMLLLSSFILLKIPLFYLSSLVDLYCAKENPRMGTQL